MPVGGCERAFAHAAGLDGIELLPQPREPWLNQRGHLGLPDEAVDTRRVLEEIFLALGGDLVAQARKRTTPLRGDFVHPDTGTLIEIDERQHFTSFRLLTLDRYPPGYPLGFEVAHYRSLCEMWQHMADRYRRTKAAAGFGVGGRQRQRAYHDALRDLGAPAVGRPPIIRIDASNNDGTDAYQRSRDRLHDLIRTV